MKSTFAWQTVGIVLGMASILSAAEVSQSAYRAPNTEAPRGEVTTRVKAQATVQKIDAKTRMIGLKGENGELFEVKAGPEVERFAEIKKGDIVVVDYVESQALYVQKPGKDEKPAHEADAVAMRMKSEKPAAAVAETEKVSAEVVSVDQKKRTITLKSAEGTISTMHVPEEVRRLNEIKKGDHIVAERTVAVAIAVQAKPK